MKAPEADPLGYVEDAFKPRTPLGAFFNILLTFFPRASAPRPESSPP